MINNRLTLARDSSGHSIRPASIVFPKPTSSVSLPVPPAERQLLLTPNVTLDDVKSWKAERERHGATPDDCFVCSPQAARRAKAMSRHTLRRRFQKACRVLGTARHGTLTIHHGRHTFISHALAGGRTLAEVRDSAGHSSVLVTSAYLHIAVDEDAQVGELFGFE
jgi:integrase